MTEASSVAGDPLVHAILRVELPTLGHFLEDGFCDTRIRPVGAVGRMAGRAVTVDLTEPDAIAVNHALLRLRPGSVLVIQVHGGRHAPVGAVTAAAAAARGAAGIVVDGPVTDLSALKATAAVLPVFATGATALTTKRLGTATAGVGRPVIVGGVPLSDGDLVAGDENGVVAFGSDALDADILDAALRSDLAEPELLARIRRGDSLEDLLALDIETL
ncbi:MULTISPECIES: RraA family protein [unclassified Microbacterium]|uniref:RraA family protein n=1 Tax=unclassified Microbacterium TaxID=2609290 RepID=UPI000EA97EDE|nr:MULTISPECIES: RraA family protein [unclassified Microbacterium]MBT2484498.1 RraA family protein [Microbacterium sp. ISL-108]RKN67403.1 RraA family protein [Microbacterium sp. CGR2]